MPSISDSIGRVLGDRYRLVTALGTGASAHVFLADDVSLHRRVAIKVLHPALSADAGFLKRFRAEARVAAALNHPNILQVYDWGEEGNEPYLVLEYLAGGSLRQVLDTGVLLTPEQAVRIGLEATAGLDYAHRRGLVHRDIKPANLLFGDDQRLRIADFGLARALAEAAWTEPQGAVLGTARYAAPEQAEGKVVDGRADVYSLALVLFETVTGEVPFAADTTVATLMGRIGMLLPEHEALGPLNDILVWAAAPDPAERYDAADLAMRLQAAALTLPDPAPLPLATEVPSVSGTARSGAATVAAAGAAAAGVAAGVRTSGGLPGADGDITEIGAQPVKPVTPVTPPPPPPSEEGARGGRRRKGTADDDTGVVDTVGAAAGGTVAGEAGVAGVADGEAAPEDPGPATARRRWPWIVGVVVVVAALVAAGTVFAVRDKLFTPSHPVPAVVGLTVAAAQQVAAREHLDVHQSAQAFSIPVAAGKIISQQPTAAAPGATTPSLKQGSAIDVVVSEGPPPVAIPSVTSFTSCRDAIAALATVHLVGVCPASVAQYSSTVGTGGILGTVQTGTAPYGSTVQIITSKGHAPVDVPVVTGSGSTYGSASAALKAAGFVPKESTEYSSSVTKGEVIGTTPSASSGPQPYGSTVTVAVSEGPQPVDVPDVVGDSVSQATAALQAVGLQASEGYGVGDTVVFTLPAAGSQVLPGATVNLYTA